MAEVEDLYPVEKPLDRRKKSKGPKRGEDEQTSFKKTYEVLGVVASVLSLTSYIPVTVDVFSHPNTFLVETTFLVYGISIAANLLWLAYGIGHKSLAIIVTSLVVITISIIILIYIVVVAYDNVFRLATSSSTSDNANTASP